MYEVYRKIGQSTWREKKEKTRVVGLIEASPPILECLACISICIRRVV